jgi:hypothetical protein
VTLELFGFPSFIVFTMRITILPPQWLLVSWSLLFGWLSLSDAFQANGSGWKVARKVSRSLSDSASPSYKIPVPVVASITTDAVQEASKILSDWDKNYNPEVNVEKITNTDIESTRDLMIDAVRLLSAAATQERDQDLTTGRCMLGICASSTEEGIATLKSWVTSLELPRGLLHGMDKDGVPLQIDGGAYIKYKSGGSLTFSAIRNSGVGFDALWKPGDAMLESYDGTYRGVYFQVDLSDGEFRQYMLPLDTWDPV